MSYAMDLSAEARLGLAKLPIEIQEEVLDLLEVLADQPALLVPRGAAPDVVHDFTKLAGNLKHYVFVLVQADRSASVLHVKAIGHAAREVR